MTTEITIHSGDHYLVAYIGEGNPDCPFFIYNKTEEGVSLSHKDMAEVLEKAFNEHF